jgi:hypothetical protein
VSLNRFPPPSRHSHRNLAERGAAAPLSLDLGGWSYRFRGMDVILRRDLESRYEAFLAPDQPEAFEVDVLDGKVDQFIPVPDTAARTAHPLSLIWEGPDLLLRSYGFTGWISPGEARGQIALARGGFEKPGWCVENFLRAGLAWRALEEGGMLFHAASLIRGDLAFLFLGASGSGKSTLASIAREGRVVSDDLTLVRKMPEGYRVAGTPFRGTYTGGLPVKGLFPIAGVYRILKAERERLEACPAREALAILLANCPFVVDHLAMRPEILDRLGAFQASHPLAYLHFTLRGDFWSVLPPG